MSFKKIFICGGHGRNGKVFDPGAVSKDKKTTEREIIVSVGMKLKDILTDDRIIFVNIEEQLNHSARVHFVNTICKNEGLTYRDSLFIELHCDWYGASEGVCSYYYSGSNESEEMADLFGKTLAEDTGRNFRWAKGDHESRGGSLYVIRKTIPLAILLEIGSLRADKNKNDGLEYIGSEKGQQEIAESIAKITGGLLYKKEDSDFTSDSQKNDAIEELKEIWEIGNNLKDVGERVMAKASQAAGILRS